MASQMRRRAASSLGKWPRVLIVLRICMCRLSTVLVGVDDAADVLGEGEEGDQALPGALPGLERRGAVLAGRPGRAELVEHLAGGVRVGGGIDPPELAGAALALLPG